MVLTKAFSLLRSSSFNVFQIPIDMLTKANGQEDRKYQAFNETQESFIAFRVYALLFSVYCCVVVAVRLSFLLRHGNDMSSGNKMMEIAHLIASCLLIGLIWGLVYIKRKATDPSKTDVVDYDHEMQPINQMKILLQCMIVVGETLILGTWLLMRVAVGQCNDYYSFDNFRCNPSQDSGTLPIDSVVAIMLVPLATSIVFRGIPFPVQLFSWAMTIGFIVCSAAFVRLDQSAVSLCIFVPTSLFMLYEGERQNRMMFHLTDRMAFLLQENERLADETHANELRHMLGNVAHDLKTPLTAFITCMDMMGTTLDGFEVNSEKGSMTAAEVQSNVTQLCDLLGSLKNASTFMTMAINRCVDFTRASKGMTLISHPETFNLRRAMNLPMRVITDMQSRIGVTLLPIPLHICSHVLSDLQWLQENILCLVSNGVKYTSVGEVEIQITLQDSNDLRYEGGFVDPNLCQSSRFVVGNLQSQSLSPSRPLSPNDTFSGDVVGDLSEYKEKSVRTHAGDMLAQRIPGGVIFLSRRLVQNRDRPSRKSEKNNTSYLRFEVSDCGIGLTEESMLTIFNPFKQTQRMNGGVGLGLYSLSKRVHALGGYYGVTTRTDGHSGCRFFFGVPYVPDELTASLKEKPVLKSFMSTRQDRKVVAADSLLIPIEKLNINSPIQSAMRDAAQAASQLRILLVDDTMTVLKMVSMVLRKQGHIVETASHGGEALDKLDIARLKRSHIFDLVLIDLQMPVMDGFEAMRRIREGEQERQQTGTQAAISTRTECVTPAAVAGPVANSAALSLALTPDMCDKVVDIEMGLKNDSTSFYLSHSKKLKQMRKLARQCIVAMSANGDPATSSLAFAAGADKFICKPFAIDQLNAVLEELVQAGKL